MMIEAKQFVEQEGLEKKESVSIEEVKQLIEEANQQAEAARELFPVQQGKENKKMISKYSKGFKEFEYLCTTILLVGVKEWVDFTKNFKQAKKVHCLKWKGKLPLCDQNEIISKIENSDKDTIYVFTDGSCRIDKTNRMNDASGVGIIIISTEADQLRIITMRGPISKPSGGHSSQYAELFAIETALYEICLWEGYVGQKVVISTDNLEVVEAFNQYKERGMAGQVCSLDFNQMKSRDNKYFPIYKLVQLFRVDNDKVPMFNLQFEHVYSTHSCEDVNNRRPTKPRNPGNEEADKLAAEGRRATSWTTTLFKATTDAFEVLGLESEECDVLGSAEEEPTLMDCANAMDIDID